MKELFLLNSDIEAFDEIIIYGAGNAGRGVLLKLLQRNVGVSCFADSDPEKCGTRIMNIPVYHINELADKTDSAVIVAGKYIYEVAPLLAQRGYKNLFFDSGNELGFIHLGEDTSSNV